MTTRRGTEAGLRGRWATAAVIAAVAVLAGCSAGSGADATSAADMSAAESAVGSDQGSVAPESLASVVGAAEADRAVVVSGSVVLTADEPITVAGTIATAVESAGGYVDGRSETQGEPSEGSDTAPERAQLTVRVPPGEVQPMIDAMRDLGEVSSVDLTSADVTQQVADLETRISAKRVAITRLEELLTSAGTVADLLAVEGELTTRQSELEQLLTEQAGVDDLTAMATIEVSVYATDQAPEQQTEVSGFVGGLSAGWDALVKALGATVTVLGVLLPWVVVAGAVGAVVLLTVRRTRRRAGRGAPAADVPSPEA